MKYLLYIIFVLSCLSACSIAKPTDFTYQYKNEPTDIEKLIAINGCYVFPYKCDSNFYTVAVFYPDGLFLSATTSQTEPIIECLINSDNTNAVCKYPSWGLYELKGDTIKTQTLRGEGITLCTIFRDYLILSDSSLVNVSDYVNSDKTKIGYMKNYPSFKNNPCKQTATFIPLNLSDIFCPLTKLKWFNNCKQK